MHECLLADFASTFLGTFPVGNDFTTSGCHKKGRKILSQLDFILEVPVNNPEAIAFKVN